MSTAASTTPGSRLVTSLASPKRKVWSAASVSDDPPLLPPPQAAANVNAPNATARERNVELLVIRPPHGTRREEGAHPGAFPNNPSPSSRRTGARVRRRRTSPSHDGPLLHAHLGAFHPGWSSYRSWDDRRRGTSARNAPP